MGVNLLRIYFDACIAIYLVEEHPTFAPKIETHLANQVGVADVLIHISDLTEMECLVMPLRKQNQVLTNKFEQWFDTVEILPVNKQVFRQAARLRADFSTLKTPDAIHLAAALHHGCDEFWTNDDRLSRIAPNLVKDIVTT